MFSFYQPQQTFAKALLPQGESSSTREVNTQLSLVFCVILSHFTQLIPVASPAVSNKERENVMISSDEEEAFEESSQQCEEMV